MTLVKMATVWLYHFIYPGVRDIKTPANNIVTDEVMVNQMYHARVTEKIHEETALMDREQAISGIIEVVSIYWIYALINAGSSDYYTFINNRNLS